MAKTEEDIDELLISIKHHLLDAKDWSVHF
jgi:hypothetical protein